MHRIYTACILTHCTCIGQVNAYWNTRARSTDTLDSLSFTLVSQSTRQVLAWVICEDNLMKFACFGKYNFEIQMM